MIADTIDPDSVIAVEQVAYNVARPARVLSMDRAVKLVIAWLDEDRLDLEGLIRVCRKRRVDWLKRALDVLGATKVTAMDPADLPKLMDLLGISE